MIFSFKKAINHYLTPLRNIIMENDKPKLKLAKTNCPTCGEEVFPIELIPAGDRKICPNCRDTYVQSLKEGARNPAEAAKGTGTGGATPNRELKAIARESLSGGWGSAALISFLNITLQSLPGLIPFLGSLVQLAIAGPVTLGYSQYFMGAVRGEAMNVDALFSGFSNFWKSVGLYFMISLIVFATVFFAVIPGAILMGVAHAMAGQGSPEGSPLFVIAVILICILVVAASLYVYLRYSLVFFILNDDPDIGVFEALKESVRRMSGHKKKLLKLFLSFIPWIILGMLAFFIGIFWAAAYMMTAFAAFYDDLGEEA